MKDWFETERKSRVQQLNTQYGIQKLPRRRMDFMTAITILVAGIAIGMVVIVGLQKTAWSKSKSENCTTCHHTTAHGKMTEYFRRNGSTQPSKMATAVLMTSKPRLLAAVAKIETNGKPETRRTGYRNRYDGSFQVDARHWGPVPRDPVAQARQADAILTELIADHGDLKKALNAYGGDKTRKVYALNVLRELEEVPR